MDQVEVDPMTGEVRTTPVPEHLAPSFDLKVQPSKFSCVPTAFAMIMGLDPKDVVEAVGHDDARGFHVQELLSIGLEFGWAFSPHELRPEVEALKCPDCDGYGRVPRQTDVYGDFDYFECEMCGGSQLWRLTLRVAKFSYLLGNYNGVLTGKVVGREGFHAVAWCSKIQKCLDPVGTMYGIEQFEPDTFWLAVQMKE